MNDEETIPRRHVYSVKEFTSGLASWFARKSFLANIAIAGEVSGVHPFGSGHVGFVLKEQHAVLECVVWSDRRRELPELRNGMSVVATGSIGVRPDRGCYQLVVQEVEPTGLGALFVLYERLKEKFRVEGLFEAARKRAVPEFPRRVALVSARGEAMADFVQTLAREAPLVAVEFIETRVQGEGAEIDIAAAIDDASSRDVDIIVLTRGGGSYEDLFPFNLEPVVRAIVRSRHAVVTAIGHIQHHHLSDDVADLNFHTPSLAATHVARGWTTAIRRVVDAKRALLSAAKNIVLLAARRADDATRGLQREAERLVERKRARVLELSVRLTQRSPQEIVGRNRARLLSARSGLTMRFERLLNEARRTIERTEARLETFNVAAALGRGYAIVTHDGRVVRNSSILRAGDALEARFERGMAKAIVESVGSDG